MVGEEAAAELAGRERIDGLLLNGSVSLRAPDRSAAGLPTPLATHVVANVGLAAGVLPLMARTGERYGGTASIVHTSTGCADLSRKGMTDVRRGSRVGVVVYTRAKAVTEMFAFGLDRRLRVVAPTRGPGAGVASTGGTGARPTPDPRGRASGLSPGTLAGAGIVHACRDRRDRTPGAAPPLPLVVRPNHPRREARCAVATPAC